MTARTEKKGETECRCVEIERERESMCGSVTKFGEILTLGKNV